MGSAPPFGHQLRYWRARRRLSQLDFSLEAEVSARHLSFLETGRAHPSREMVLRLSRVLDLPLRERNDLLLAAGYAPSYSARSLDDPRMASIRAGLEFLLSRHEPYPAFVVDRRWDIRIANSAHRRMLALIQGVTGESAAEPENAMRLVLAPNRLRPVLANWPQVARVALARLDRQVRAGHGDDLLALRDELLAYPDVRGVAAAAGPGDEGGLLIPMVFSLGGHTLSWYTTIATFGAPLDATLQEAVIESLLPADEPTRRFVHQLAAADTSGAALGEPAPATGSG